MTSSILLRVLGAALLPLLLLVSAWVLVRGHQHPGGGFSAGLLSAGALVLYALGHGSAALRKRIGGSPELLAGIGLLIAVASGVVGSLVEREFLSAVWWSEALGTPIVFDVGVYLVVLGVAVAAVLALWEEDLPWKS